MLAKCDFCHRKMWLAISEIDGPDARVRLVADLGISDGHPFFSLLVDVACQPAGVRTPCPIAAEGQSASYRRSGLRRARYGSRQRISQASMKEFGNDGLQMNGFAGRLLSFAVLLGFFALGHQHGALAQAGSTGGIIGKQEKSVSGGEDSEPIRTKPPKHKSSQIPVKKPSQAAGRCSNVVGSYSYPYGSVTVFKSDGTATNSAGPQGTWKCAGGTVTVNWNTGYNDRLTPSGGSSFSGSNNHGWTWSAKPQ